MTLSVLLAVLAASSLPAQSITVAANRAFRPTAVLLPHVQYTLATDTLDGALIIRDLTVNPVTFAGMVRIEGIQPLERSAEPRPGVDMVRFDADGRVVMSVSNGPGRPPLSVEVFGCRGAPGGRIVVTGRDWPLTRVVLVTISPADIQEYRWRSVGYGVEDRVRIDDRQALAFLSDTSAGPVTVAIGYARPASGRIQGDATSILVQRRYGPEAVRERRRVAALTMVLDPVRDSAGSARAEIVFGVGNSEQEAAQAAATAAREPVSYATGSPLQVTTPSGDAGLLLAHILGAARPMLDYDGIAGLRNMPAGSYTFLAAFDRDGWYGAITALQLGDADVVCSEYRLMQRYAEPSGAQRHEIWNRLGPRGVYIWTDEWGGRWMGDKDAYQILKGYACYRAGRDRAWLARELPALRRIARFILATDSDGDALVEGASDATYSEMSPLAPDSTYRAEDPYVNSLTAWTLDRLAELEEAGGGDSAAAWREAADRIRSALPALWRPALQWFAYHAVPDGSRSWDHYHIQPVDALVFGGVQDSAVASAMVTQLLRSEWWDAAERGFYAVPTGESWQDMESYWRGLGWHIMDFKALHAAFVYGSAAQRRAAWERLAAEAGRIVRTNYGRPGERSDNNGLFMFSAGSYLDLLSRGLFGVDEHLDRIDVTPHVDGISDEFTWRLDGWRLADDTLSIAYRPADRAATIRLNARTRKRVVLRFPWLASGACATVQRGGDVERLAPVFQVDGSAYLDIRAAFDPAAITVSARPCGG